MNNRLTDYYRGRKVLVTGHTGFKGAWLCSWLLEMEAEVHGIALDPQMHEVLYDQLGLAEKLASDTRGDICDKNLVKRIITDIRPDIILHLAAQPLVRLSYEIPVETFETNVMGTVHLLDALLEKDYDCSVVCVTTDKCYENLEWLHAYREEDAMGGHDPYSASKGAAELVISSYRRSYFCGLSKVKVASARAGNVIGGGDWAKDRIIPDCIRAIRKNEKIPVRNKIATRPWQHVLEPLSGYLWLGARLSSAPDDQGPILAGAFNFGPNLSSNRTVAELVDTLSKHIGGEWEDCSERNARHEASKLNLAIDKAFHTLNWKPVWDFQETLRVTAEWYTNDEKENSSADLTTQQIHHYINKAKSMGILWASSS